MRIDSKSMGFVRGKTIPERPVKQKNDEDDYVIVVLFVDISLILKLSD